MASTRGAATKRKIVIVVNYRNKKSTRIPLGYSTLRTAQGRQKILMDYIGGPTTVSDLFLDCGTFKIFVVTKSSKHYGELIRLLGASFLKVQR